MGNGQVHCLLGRVVKIAIVNVVVMMIRIVYCGILVVCHINGII